MDNGRSASSGAAFTAESASPGEAGPSITLGPGPVSASTDSNAPALGEDRRAK